MNQKYQLNVFSDWKHRELAASNDLEWRDGSRSNSYRSHRIANRFLLNPWNASLLRKCDSGTDGQAVCDANL